MTGGVQDGGGQFSDDGGLHRAADQEDAADALEEWLHLLTVMMGTNLAFLVAALAAGALGAGMAGYVPLPPGVMWIYAGLHLASTVLALLLKESTQRS
ncbi:hypothetical protein [Streptomyces sp. NPDC002851]